MSIKDGGPAYPCQPLEREGMPSAAKEPGLSIRDHFAGLAMQATLATRVQIRLILHLLPKGSQSQLARQ